MTHSESIKEVAAALAKAQAGIRNAAQDKTNPAFKSKYADLASVWEACRHHLSANGIAVVQAPAADGPKVTVTTILAHSSGEWLSCDLTVTADKGTAQGIGSAITYARRYGLSSMVGVAPGDDIADEGDDDGNVASGRQAPPPKAAPKPAPKPLDAARQVLVVDVYADRIRRAKDLAELENVAAELKRDQQLTAPDLDKLRDEYALRHEALKVAA